MENELCLDLGETQIASSLALIKGLSKDQKREIHSVQVHTRSLLWHGNSSSDNTSVLDLCVFLYGFEALGSLPNLCSLSIELDEGILPVMALTVVLKSCKRLQKLVLNRVDLQGDHEDITSLEAAVQKHRCIQKINLSHVTGNGAAVSALWLAITNSSSNRHHQPPLSHQGIHLTSTPALPEGTLKSMCSLPSPPQISTLTLEDVPDLYDSHILWLWKAFASSNTLTELTLQSQKLGNVAGEAICSLLKVNTSLQKVKIHLGRDWSSCATSMAQVLQQNKSLKCLDLLLYGKTKHSVEADIECLARALTYTSNQQHLLDSTGNSPLEEFLLCLDLDPLVDEPVEQTVIKSFDNMLQTNPLLSHLTIAECEFLNYPISNASMERKLRFNRSGIPRLVLDQGGSNNSYIKAMATETNNIDLLFYALLNKPSLFITATAVPSKKKYHQRQHQTPEEQLVSLRSRIQTALDVIEGDDDDDDFGGDVDEEDSDDLLKDVVSSNTLLPSVLPRMTPRSTNHKATVLMEATTTTTKGKDHSNPLKQSSSKPWRRRMTTSLTGMMNFKA